ncbi:MAG TPA: TM2 domain-containing protein [Kofleriaceae bacterium]|nr:TM2 domain-containing protein [Kofleriaceae bacterium]
MSDHEEFSPGVAFGLWLACLFGLCGVHRFYLGKPFTGLLYLFTFGLLGVGQVVDLVRLRGMVEEKNLLAEARARRAFGSETRAALPAGPARDPAEQMRQDILKAAAQRKGNITVAQAVMATGKSFEEVEQMLDAMAAKGYVDIDNDPDTGVVVYRFGDLA